MSSEEEREKRLKTGPMKPSDYRPMDPPKISEAVYAAVNKLIQDKLHMGIAHVTVQEVIVQSNDLLVVRSDFPWYALAAQYRSQGWHVSVMAVGASLVANELIFSHPQQG